MFRRVAPFRSGPWFLAALACACRTAEDDGSAGPTLPSAVAHVARARAFDVRSYALEVELLPQSRSIRCVCRVRLQSLDAALDEVRLDLIGLEVEGVCDERGRALTFRRPPGELRITLAEPLAPGAAAELEVRYHGRPERGLWFAGARADGSGPTLVFSHGQTQDNRGWFPCFDEPEERASTELALTMPAEWIAVACGERVAARVAEGRRTESWRMEFPHPSYLVSLVAGELVQEEGRAGAVPLAFLAEPRYREWIGPTFEETDEILAFLEEFTGRPYPFAKYSQAAVDNFPWGGMENISATTLTPLILTDERGRRDNPPHALIAHEAAHQWFGDLLTCADWSHLWLNEGFASYCALLYIERTRGTDEFRAQLRETQEAYLEEDVGAARRATVWNVWKEPDDVFDTRAYQGAAARLHFLRFVLGDEAFARGVRDYVAANAGRGVVTADLQQALERNSGRDLEAIFAQWLLHPGFPEFALDWEWDAAARAVVLEVEQVQESLDGTPAVFTLPVEVEVREDGGAHVARLEIDERRERFELPAATAPLYVSFDPHGWIPKRVHEEKKSVEWQNLARLAEDVNLRREAVLVLGRLAAFERERERPDSPELAALLERARSDRSAWVRADAATALGQAGGVQAEEELRRAALEDGEVRVRAAALAALRAFGPDAGLASLAEEAFYTAPSYQTMAAAAGLLCAAAPERAFEFLAAGVELESPHDVLAGLLLALFAELSDPRVPQELRAYAADATLAPTARAAAVQGLARATRGGIESARFLLPFLEEESFHLRGAAVSALASFGDEGSFRALRAYYPRAHTSVERRTIEALFERRGP